MCGQRILRILLTHESLDSFHTGDPGSPGFGPIEQYRLHNGVEDPSRNGQQCHTSVIGAGSEITFFGELDEVTLLPFCLYPLVVPDLIKERVEHLHVWPDVDLQCLCWDVVRSRSLSISQLLDSTLNLLLCECTTVNG